MRKTLFIVLFYACCSQAKAQDMLDIHKADSLRIDSLKKLLPRLKGTDRVDCMLRISLYFGYMHHYGGFRFKKDSIRRYSALAYEEAKNINYKKGVALGLLMQPADFLKEANIREAIRIGEEINDDNVLGWGYYKLGEVTSTAADFPSHIAHFKKAVHHFLRAGDTGRAAEVTIWIGEEYFYKKSDYENAIEYGKKSLELSKKPDSFFPSWQKELVVMASENMAQLYAIAGDYQNAVDQLREASYGPASLARMFCEMGQYDSALVYWNRWRNDPLWINHAEGHKGWGSIIRGRIHLGQKEYDQALEIFRNNTQGFKKMKNGYVLYDPFFFTAQIYAAKKDNRTALKYAREAIRSAQKNNDRLQLMKSYQQLSTIYYNLGKPDSAYQYLLKHTTIKDSVQNRQFLLRLYTSKIEADNIKKEAQISLLDKDNKIKEQQLKQEVMLRWSLSAGMTALILAGIFIFRTLHLKRKNEGLRRQQLESELIAQQKEAELHRLESEKKHAELQQQAIELEMQALRAQMNPHFIFNCLSSINRFILKSETKAASNYLTRFSRLIRMVLLNSQKPLISLEDELQMLQLYLEMERLRFKNTFDYNITFTNAIDADAVFIPPLLLQPFCENAIWHGLMHKEGQGQLDIVLSMQADNLHCTITDNGIGREKAAVLNSKSSEREKSLGLKITNERLALLNGEREVQSFYTIEDVKDENGAAAGTRVNIQIRYKETVEEYA